MSFRSSLAAFLVLSSATLVHAESLVVDFSDLTLAPESFYNGEPDVPQIGTFDGSFTSGGATFNNTWNRQQFGNFTFDSWGGWSYSNQTDNTTPGFLNQYSSYAGGDASGDGIYGVAFGQSPSTVRFDLPELSPGQFITGLSADFTNTTYAALSMLEGDSFAKKFGGDSGNDADFFLLSIVGFSDLGASGSIIGEVDFFLADYRFEDNSLDYIVQQWTTVDLSSLIGAQSIGFRLTSSDVGQFGTNTPLYFAMDNLVIEVVPEPSSIALFAFGLAGASTLAARRRGRHG